MIIKLLLIAYRTLWVVALPLVLIYLWNRSRRDPVYIQSIGERFGFYKNKLAEETIWFHAVSLGETRSAVALIKAALQRGDKIVLTHFTPAGRRESARLFGPEIESGQLVVAWVPFDMAWCYRRFFRTFRPKIGLTLEVEVWPAMIFAAKAAGVPLYMCNAQYASKPLARDSKGLRFRQRVIAEFAGAFVKSSLQAERFASVGMKNIVVTGELRFDQPVPEGHVVAAKTLRPRLAEGREAITIASGVEGEEELFERLAKQLAAATDRPAPLLVYVPRAPERFDAVARDLSASGLSVLRRSEALDADLNPIRAFDDVDVFLGDSLGEMFFYLSLADRVVVGAGFTPRGAHNIIEPLMMMKPVVTGPYTWTIEFPFVEAEQAGIAVSLNDPDELLNALTDPLPDNAQKIEKFLLEHTGASARTLAAIDAVLGADAHLD